MTQESLGEVSLIFLSQFDVSCDPLLNRCAAAWNLLVLYDKEIEYRDNDVFMRLFSNR